MMELVYNPCDVTDERGGGDMVMELHWGLWCNPVTEELKK